MKLIQSTLALAAALAVGVGVARAATPITFALTAYVQPGATIQAITINNASILSQVSQALGIPFPAGSRLVVDTNGLFLVVDAAGVGLVNLSAGTNTSHHQSITIGPNKAVITNHTEGFARVRQEEGNFDDGVFAFFSPIWKGTFTDTNLFNVSAQAVGGDIDFRFGSTSFSHNNLTGNDSDTTLIAGKLEFTGGSKATVFCSLSAGVYKHGFTINCSGDYRSLTFGDGILFGTMTASGTQTGGTDCFDPFNGFGFYADQYIEEL